MSELIDRQALRAAHGLGADCHDCKRDMKSCQYDRDYSLMDFCEWLDDAPTASPRWVRCEERLPNRKNKVIIVDGFGQVDVARLTDEGWQLPYGVIDVGRAKWWMPIEPPKEDA